MMASSASRSDEQGSRTASQEESAPWTDAAESGPIADQAADAENSADAAVNVSRRRLAATYRVGAAVFGLLLGSYGVIAFVHGVPLTAHRGEPVLGLPTTGILAGLSVAMGIILLVAAVLGPGIASNVNVAAGGLFLLSGLVNICLLRTPLDLMGFDMTDVIFSFIVGLGLLTCGFYGRAGENLPIDNANWRRRHGLAEIPEPDEDLNWTKYHSGRHGSA
jgi:hypothetical protein